MRLVLGTLPQMFVMAAVVAAALLVPVFALLALVAFLLFGVSLGSFLTFGNSVTVFEGIVAWWALLLLPSLVYAAYMMPWSARE